MTPDVKLVEFPARDRKWRVLEQALETAFRVEQFPENAQREILDWARNAYAEFGRRTVAPLGLSLPVLNPSAQQVLINSIKKQIQPIIDEGDRRLDRVFLQLVRAQIVIKKLEARVAG